MGNQQEWTVERNEGRGRVAVVTGGASGIGLATARVLVERAWRVVISDINVKANHEAASSIGAEAAPFDVVDDAATREAFAGIEARFGPIEALFANAGLIRLNRPWNGFREKRAKISVVRIGFLM